jgi:hypothetical protein
LIKNLGFHGAEAAEARIIPRNKEQQKQEFRGNNKVPGREEEEI